jgi:hypothetical protein
MKTCRNCLLPREVPGADLDEAGICAFCRRYRQTDHTAEGQARLQREADLERTLRSCRGDEYDCLVNLSGGKDSCYLLYRLKRDYGLKVLAFTTDMNVPDVAWANIKRTVDKLEVDHISYAPPRDFYRKLYRLLLQNQNANGAVRTVCYVCAPLFEGYALALAVEKQIPLVVAGYSPGQPEPDRMVYEFSRKMIAETDWTPEEVRSDGSFTEEELRLFWNPFRYGSGATFPRYLAPFHAWPYSQDDVMKKVVELGLASNSRHASPVHSNCPLNWLLMYSDLKNLHYNPYAPEFAALVREGKASRAQWRVGMHVVNTMIRTKTFLGRNVQTSLDWLDLKVEDLKITRPAATATPSKKVAGDPEYRDSRGGVR